MANRYWVGGTANWDATAGTKWALTSGGAGGQAVPTAADDVFFTNLSTGVCTIPTATSVTCRSIDCLGFTGTLAFAATTSILIVGNATGGAARFVAGMTLLLTGIGTLRFVATTAATTYTLTPGGKTLPSLHINAGATTTIQFANTVTSTGTITLTSGILDMNSKAVSCSVFSAGVANTRTLTMGTGNTITCTASSGTVFGAPNATNLTVTANTATVLFSGTNATFNSAAINWNGMGLAMWGGGNQTVQADGAFTVATFWLLGSAVKTDSLNISGPFTATTQLLLSGSSVTNRILVQSDTYGTSRTITCNGTISAQYVDFMDIAGAGSASWNLSAITGNSGDCGGNSGITFTSSSTQTATGTSGFTWSTHGWTTRVPLPQDDVVISNSFSASQTITADMPRLGRSISFAGATGSPTLNFSTTSFIFGSLTLASGVAPSGTSSITFAGRSTYTVTSAGQTFTQALLFDPLSGNYTLNDALICSASASFLGAIGSSIAVSSGTLTANSNVTLSGATSGLWVIGGTVNMGSGTWSISNTASLSFFTVGAATVNGSSSTIVIAAAASVTRTFTGNGQSFGTLTYTVAGSTGQLTIVSSNTFNNINFSDASNARTLAFTSSTTTTIGTNFNVNGTSGKLMSVISTSAGSAATLTKSEGVVSSDYLSIKDSAATGGAAWFAGANSTSVSGNSGWVFTIPKNSDFFRMF